MYRPCVEQPGHTNTHTHTSGSISADRGGLDLLWEWPLPGKGGFILTHVKLSERISIRQHRGPTKEKKNSRTTGCDYMADTSHTGASQ